jgi:hypothetical protein
MNLKKDDVIQSVPEFFEKIFRYAEKQTGNDPTWGFSNSVGLPTVGASLLEMILSLLPADVRPVWKKGRHFIVHDLT